MTDSSSGPASTIDARVVSMALVAFVIGSLYLRQIVHWQHAALFLVGGVLGLVLYHAAFGFTSAWRVLISDRRGAGVRGQMLMLAVACVLFFPVLGSGTPVFTDTVRGNVNPIGVSVAVGAFLFGLGMQLGGGCASGTLFTVGGGNSRMVVTLASSSALWLARRMRRGGNRCPSWRRSPWSSRLAPGWRWSSASRRSARSRVARSSSSVTGTVGVCRVRHRCGTVLLAS